MSSNPILSRLPLAATLAVALLAAIPAIHAQQARPVTANPGELTVERLFSQPSLSGNLNAGLSWAPDGKRLSYVENTGTGKNAKHELWIVDPATGQRSLLVTGDQWAAALTNPTERNSQATGLGRHAPPLYQWAPSGDAILFEGPTAFAWYDLKSNPAASSSPAQKISPTQKSRPTVSTSVLSATTISGPYAQPTARNTPSPKAAAKKSTKANSTGSIPKSSTSPPPIGGPPIPPPSLFWKWTSEKSTSFPLWILNPSPAQPISSVIPSPAAPTPSSMSTSFPPPEGRLASWTPVPKPTSTSRASIGSQTHNI